MAGIITGVSGVNREVKKVTAGMAGVNREIKSAWAGNGGVNRKVFAAGQPIGNLPIGTVVKLAENGALVDYLVVHQGLPSNLYDVSCNGTWLLRKDILGKLQWHTHDVNDYANSSINAYLNSIFLNRFDSNTCNVIKQVKIPFYFGAGGNKMHSGTNGLPCKIFLLGAKETGGPFPGDEALLSYFVFGEGVTANNKRIAYYSNISVFWWTRTAYYDNSTRAWHIRSTGIFAVDNELTKTAGVRPALVVPSETMVSSEVDVNGAYMLNA